MKEINSTLLSLSKRKKPIPKIKQYLSELKFEIEKRFKEKIAKSKQALKAELEEGLKKII